MKPLFIFLGILLAGILGYKNEPSLRYQLTGIKPGYLLGKVQPGAPADQTTVDPATLKADQLPEKVMLSADVKVTDPAAELTMTIQAGNRVKLVRIEGTNAVVSPGAGPYTGTLPIAETDLMAQLAANPPAAATASTDPFAAVPAPAPAGDSADPSTPTQPAPATDPATSTTDPAAPATDPAATTPPAPAADPFATPATDPATPATDPAATTTPAPATDPAATTTPAPATDPAATTTPAPATDPAAVATPTPAPPTPTPAPVVPAVPRATGAAGIVPIMQASIRGGQIKEFTFAQVLGWKAEPNETVDGEVFQAGSVSYKAETIFGVKTIQAKALIKGGKVQRWIWPKSGMEIK